MSKETKEKAEKWIDELDEKERKFLYTILVTAIAKDAKNREKRRRDFDAD